MTKLQCVTRILFDSGVRPATLCRMDGTSAERIPARALSLREARRHLGLSTYALAEKIGVNQSTISRYEARQMQPRLSVARRLAAFYAPLRVTIYDLDDATTPDP